MISSGNSAQLQISSQISSFFKLVSRMVVLLGRARLGLYILGNTEYFESNGIYRHWARPLKG